MADQQRPDAHAAKHGFEPIGPLGGGHLVAQITPMGTTNKGTPPTR